MNRNWNRHAAGGLPILSAAVLSAVGLLWDGALSGAIAQTAAGAAGGVIVNYDVLNSLPGQPAPAPAAPLAPGVAPALAAPASQAPSSVLAIIGPDGRPITPIKLKKPASEGQERGQVAAVTPPDAPLDMPSHVPMPEPTPDAPAPGVNADLPVSAPAVEQSPDAAVVQEAPAPREASVEPAAQPMAAQEPPAAETPPAATQPAEAQPAEVQPAETPPAEAATASAQPEEQLAEQAAAETEAGAEAEPEAEAEAEVAPDNSQPAPPIPVGGIRIIFPVDLNDVPIEANAALDDLAAQMLADDSMRIQIMCYASGDEETESKARRKSLARCINIRQYLFKKDVRTTRMDVRALGLKSEGQPADRVDIVPANS